MAEILKAKGYSLTFEDLKVCTTCPLARYFADSIGKPVVYWLEVPSEGIKVLLTWDQKEFVSNVHLEMLPAAEVK